MVAPDHSQKRRSPSGRWDEVLDVAAEIFRAKGYHAASIQDVANRLGMLKGSLYHYIDSKDDLLFGVMERFNARGVEHLREAVESADEVPVVLRLFVRRLVEQTVSNLVEAAVLNHDLRSLRPDRAASIIETRDQYERFVQDLIERGKREGHIRPTVDAKIAAIGILSMINSIYTWYRQGGPRTVDEIAESFCDLVLHGVTEGGSTP